MSEFYVLNIKDCFLDNSERTGSLSFKRKGFFQILLEIREIRGILDVLISRCVKSEFCVSSVRGCF